MKDVVTFTGTLHLHIYRNGIEVERYSERNTVVIGGFNATVRALAGRTDSIITAVAAGSDGTPPNANDTAITQPVTVTVSKVEFPEKRTVRFHFTFGYSDAVGMPIREFGLITADGTLFSRRARALIEKTADMTITGFWDITV